MDSKHSLLQWVEASGVKLIRDGTAWTGPCPFHEDIGRALWVDPAKDHWQCDGDCQTGGSLVDWVARIKRVSVSHAKELLRNEAPVSTLGPVEDIGTSTVRSLTAPFAVDDDDQTVLQQVVGYYHETLKQSPEALDYLKKRRLDDPECIDYFKLGFANRSLGYHLPEKNRKAGAALRGRLTRIGIYRTNGHENFRGCIVIPTIRDGLIEDLYGRKITRKLRPGTPAHCRLPNKPDAVFNLEAVQLSDELIVCASLIDALTFWCAGYRNVTGGHGIDGITETHVSTYVQFGVKRVSIAFGATPEGDTAANKLAEQLIERGIDAYRIEFPRGLDANALAMQVDTPAQHLGRLIRRATWLGKGNAPLREVGTGLDLDVESIEPESVDESDATEEASGSDTVAEGAEHTEDTPEEADNASNTKEVKEAPLPAQLVPSPPNEIPAEITDGGIVIQIEDRRYRIRGLEKNLSYETLHLNVLVQRGVPLHVDTFNLYSAKHRGAFMQAAASALNVDPGIIKADLSKVLLKLEVLQDQQIQQALTPKPNEIELTDKERQAALALLEAPDLVDRILADYRTCGVVGEDTNKLVGYLAALSRKLEKPLAVMVQSTSAAGKSALMDAVLSFIPEEERVQYSAMTGQSLFYMGNLDLKHKILAINEEEGAAKATYALKLLQSDGRLTIASTGKDPHSGRHVTHEYQVEGPVMIFSTTAAADIDEELQNRCLLLTVDEDRDQTRAIHDYQRFEETIEGLQAAQQRESIRQLHRNAQRLLKPLKVVNPFAEQLTFLDDKTRTRRDHKKYLTLIRSIALLHQYQREVKQTFVNGEPIEYVEVTVEDIALANRIAHDVLGQSLDDLPPQTRRLLMLIDQMVSEQCRKLDIPRDKVRFGRKQIREYTGFGSTQLTVHLQRLEKQEYLLIHRGGRGLPRVYELLYRAEGQDGQPFLMGLVDADSLKPHADEANRSGSYNMVSAPDRGTVGAASVPNPSRVKLKIPRLGRGEPCPGLLEEPNTTYAQKTRIHTVGERHSDGGGA